jgi:hypothetical protein
MFTGKSACPFTQDSYTRESALLYKQQEIRLEAMTKRLQPFDA